MINKYAISRRKFIKSTGIALGTSVAGSLLNRAAFASDLRKFQISGIGNYDGRVIWACSARPLPKVEKAVRQAGAGNEFHFEGARIYFAPTDPGIHDGTYGNWNDDRVLSPLMQGRSGFVSIPLISMTCEKYPEVWAGNNDQHWKKQFDSIETYWGSVEKPVDGPWGKGAYPVILSFQHEFTDNAAAGRAYDHTFTTLTQPQQYAKAMRCLVDLQRNYKPGLNVKWTWIPMAYSFWNYKGTGLAPVTNYWPARIDGKDDGAPDFANTDYIDIVGCDGYMSEADFTGIYNQGGEQSNRSVVGFARSIGAKVNGKPKGLPWLIGEWGIDERYNNPEWKKNTLEDMMRQLATNYKDLVYMSIWPTATRKNDNRWNSTAKKDNTPSGYGTPDDKGISAQAFAKVCASERPHGRPLALFALKR